MATGAQKLRRLGLLRPRNCGSVCPHAFLSGGRRVSPRGIASCPGHNAIAKTPCRPVAILALAAGNGAVSEAVLLGPDPGKGTVDHWRRGLWALQIGWVRGGKGL